MKLAKLWPFIIIAVICFLIFSKFFVKGLYPVPGDLLASFYFPWYSGGWEGYNPWTTHKATIGDDSLRQQIPWVKLGFDEIKKGNMPLWNPYNFSGTPHLANIQAFIFYPLNFAFLLLPLLYAWSLLIFMQFFLGMIFFYLFLKKIKISTYPALLASASFVFSSFFVFNSQINIIGHSIIWMPLILYSYESLKEKFQARYLIICSFAFCATILGGNTQSAVYALLLSFAYVFFMDIGRKPKRKAALLILGSFIFALLLTSFQLIPTLELYLNSPLGTRHPQFDKFLMPPKNLITFLAPDFFGNPATNNFWARLYGDGTPHIGIIPIIFAVFALFNLRDLRAQFFTITTVVSLLFIMPSPLSWLIKVAGIPVLSGSPPVRAAYITTFCLSFLAAYGLNSFLKNHKSAKSFIKTLGLFIVTYGLVWIYVLVTIKTNKDPQNILNFKISLRNLIIPSTTFGLFLIVTFTYLKFKQKKIFLIAIFTLTILPFLYTTNKVIPFSPKQFFFPNHPIISYLKSDDISRFYGIDTARFDTNFASYFGIYSPEGYGILRVKRYAQLVAASADGKIPNSYERADAIFPNKENDYRKRAFDLLGVKYFLDKNDLENKDWNPEPDRFPADNIKLIWQQGKFKIYERKDALPRYFQTTHYSVLKDEEIIPKIYDRNFDLKTVLLEKEPNIQIENINQFAIPKLESYEPNSLKFKTDTSYSSLLFLSDAYENGWKSYIDGQEAPILRADYAFRSVAVPKGSHEVVFKYQPKSFIWGSIISLISLALVIIFVKIEHAKRKF